jgi:hypothetical protein
MTCLNISAARCTDGGVLCRSHVESGLQLLCAPCCHGDETVSPVHGFSRLTALYRGHPAAAVSGAVDGYVLDPDEVRPGPGACCDGGSQGAHQVAIKFFDSGESVPAGGRVYSHGASPLRPNLPPNMRYWSPTPTIYLLGRRGGAGA